MVCALLAGALRSAVSGANFEEADDAVVAPASTTAAPNGGAAVARLIALLLSGSATAVAPCAAVVPAPIEDEDDTAALPQCPFSRDITTAMEVSCHLCECKEVGRACNKE